MHDKVWARRSTGCKELVSFTGKVETRASRPGIGVKGVIFRKFHDWRAGGGAECETDADKGKRGQK